MKVSIQAIVVLSAFSSSLVAALPPAIPARTASSSPATRIITTSPAARQPSTDTAATRNGVTPTGSTATSISLGLFSSRPPVAVPIAAPVPIPNEILELRSALASVTPATPKEELSSTITAALTVVTSGAVSSEAFQEKWYQTTYWSCVTEAIQTHCGWHEPVLPGGDDSIANARRRGGPPQLFAAAGVAAAVAMMVVGGW